MCPFGPSFLSANVRIYNILLVLASATLIHLLEVIRLEACQAAGEGKFSSRRSA